MANAAHPLLALLQTFVTQIGGYFAVVGLLFVVVWVWGVWRGRKEATLAGHSR